MDMSMRFCDRLFHLKDKVVFMVLPMPAASRFPGRGKLVFVGEDYIAVECVNSWSESYGKKTFIPISQIILIGEEA